MLEYEHGGPFTPSPAPSPMKKSLHGTPVANTVDSPAIRATFALNATLHSDVAPTPPSELPRPAIPSGFIPVNSGGFTAVNAHSALAPSVPPSTPTPFAAVNVPSSLQRENMDSRTSTPMRNGSPMLSAQNTPDLRPTGIGLTPLSNGQPFNQLKRTLSQDAEGSVNGDADDANGRRSKRLKKGKFLCACVRMQSRFTFCPRQDGRGTFRIESRHAGCLLQPSLDETMADEATCRWCTNSRRLPYDSTSPINTRPKWPTRTCCRRATR